VAASGLTIKPIGPRRSDSIPAELLHAVGESIGPSTRGRASEGLALPNMHEARAARIPAADSGLK
jgi:hypothetical protein